MARRSCTLRSGHEQQSARVSGRGLVFERARLFAAHTFRIAGRTFIARLTGLRDGPRAREQQAIGAAICDELEDDDYFYMMQAGANGD